MAGTLSSLNTALTALRFNRVAMDVAANNIANATTEGYARRRVEGTAIGAPAQPAMWSRYDGTGGGVATGATERMVDSFLDARARREHGAQSYLDVRAGVLRRVESGIGEPGDNGVAAAMANFRSGWHDLANDPGGDAARSQLLARAETVAGAIRNQATNVATEQSDQRYRLQAMVSEVNTVASELAATNANVAVAKLNGTEAGTLLDQRDQLALRLSELTGSVATVRTDGGLDVTVGGIALVTGKDAGTFQITGGVTASGGDDGQPVNFAVVGGATAATVPTGLRGEVGAVADLLTTTLPAYADGLSAFARAFADTVNAQHAAGYDITGAAGQPLFSYDPADVAGTLAVAVTDPDLVAASGVPGGGLDGSNADLLGVAGAGDGDYQRLVNAFGTEVASVQRLSASQGLLTQQVDGAREQLSGVNLD
ncbi:MAG: flagellar hook-associated protein FlgK, partial [Nocardioides sp.]|nr:flagellar hook-associated protein FlgK [Nocardioides sp.]